MSYARVQVSTRRYGSQEPVQRFEFFDENDQRVAIKEQPFKPATTAIAPWNRKVPNGNRHARRT
jgi:hypothetical protein